MTLAGEDIQKFIRIYKEEFKEDINEDEAREMAGNLLELYSTIAETLPRAVSDPEKVRIPPLVLIDIIKPKRPET